MAYALFSDVETRAGRYGTLFSVAGKQPDEDAVESLLTDVSAELDAAIGALGHTVPVTDVAALNALRDTTAYGALSRALASVPSGDKGLDELKRFAERVWTKSLDAISSRKHAVIVLLDAGATGATAGSFWDDEPDYDPRSTAELDLPDSIAPAFQKGQSL